MFLLFVGFSMALGCDDIKTMIDARMPSDIIIETIKNSSYKSSEEDLICLLKYSNIDINVINYLLNINNSGKKMELSFDCLAGFCLNQESGSLGDDVFLIGNKYNVVRSIEVCAGVVSKIMVTRYFSDAERKGTVFKYGWSVVGYMFEYSIYMNYIDENLKNIKFYSTGIPRKGQIGQGEIKINTLSIDLINDKVFGVRNVLLMNSTDGLLSQIVMSTTLPNYEQVCMADRLNGFK